MQKGRLPKLYIMWCDTNIACLHIYLFVYMHTTLFRFMGQILDGYSLNFPAVTSLWWVTIAIHT